MGMLSGICPDAACWDATGSMMQGWAAWAGVLAVIYAARRAADTFGTYRRQKQEDRRIDAAERVLTLAYRIKADLEASRSPMGLGHEHSQAHERLKEAQWYLALGDGERSRSQSGQIILDRLERERATWDEVFSTMPLARALFGEAVEEQLRTLYRQVRAVQVSAQMYRDRMGTDEAEFRSKLERDMWAMGEPDADRNPVGLAVANAIGALEEIMLPIIRADHSKPAREWALPLFRRR